MLIYYNVSHIICFKRVLSILFFCSLIGAQGLLTNGKDLASNKKIIIPYNEESEEQQFIKQLYFGGNFSISRMVNTNFTVIRSNGFGGSIFAGFQMIPRLSVEGELNYYLHSPIANKNKTVDPDTQKEIDIYKTSGYGGLLLLIRYIPFFKSNFKLIPYFSIGRGFQSFIFTLTDEAFSITPNMKKPTDRIFSDSIVIDIGIDHHLKSKYSIRTYIRYYLNNWDNSMINSNYVVDFDWDMLVLSICGYKYF